MDHISSIFNKNVIKIFTFSNNILDLHVTLSLIMDAIWVKTCNEKKCHPTIKKKMVFSISKSSKKIPNLNRGQKYHCVILNKSISTCPL